MKESRDAGERGTPRSEEDPSHRNSPECRGKSHKLSWEYKGTSHRHPQDPGSWKNPENTGSNCNLRRLLRNLPDIPSTQDDTDTKASTSNSEADEASEIQEPSQNIGQPLRSSSTTPA